MPDDLPIFLGAIALFILYLVWSAATEMGTQKPKLQGLKLQGLKAWLAKASEDSDD